jgi:hypothetical protein
MICDHKLKHGVAQKFQSLIAYGMALIDRRTVYERRPENIFISENITDIPFQYLYVHFPLLLHMK